MKQNKSGMSYIRRKMSSLQAPISKVRRKMLFLNFKMWTHLWHGASKFESAKNTKEIKQRNHDCHKRDVKLYFSILKPCNLRYVRDACLSKLCNLRYFCNACLGKLCNLRYLMLALANCVIYITAAMPALANY